MTAPKLEACYFLPERPSDAAIWTRLAAVLEASARVHCAGWDVQVRQLPPPPRPPWNGTCSSGFIGNTLKLEYWSTLVAEANEGDWLLLLDADTLILQPLDAIWDQPFDVAYTVRPPSCKYPLNAGVVFVRVSPGTVAFFRDWCAQNRIVLQNTFAVQPWRRQFGGLNQAALGKLLGERGAAGLTLLEVPCVEWNCEDSTWAAFDPALTRILHVKSALRAAVLHDAAVPRGAARVAELWREADLATRATA